MSIITNLSTTPAGKPDVASTVKHMTGMLWYEMLSELNKTGLDSNALGTGGDDFQGMFLWNIAQNDFGKYDSGLLAATMRQVGGAAASPDLPKPAMQTMQAAAMPIPVAAPEAVPAKASQPAGNLATQAVNFAKSIWPQVNAAAQVLGVPAVAVLAQTALETGWGSAAPGNNLFGVKAVDGESGTSRATHEMTDGVLTPQTATFRDYASAANSVSDYVQQIQSGFPGAAGQSTVGGFATALQQAGYATDTNYAAKLVSISQSPMMAQVLHALGADNTQNKPISSTAGST